MKMNKRLFFAIELDSSTKAAVTRNAQMIHAACKSGSFTRADKYHITLAFLGNIPEERIPELKVIADKINCKDIRLWLNGISSFNIRGSQLIYQAVEGEKRLYNLQERLIKELKKADFQIEDVPYRPHITMVRKAVLQDGVTLPSLSGNSESGSFTADHMTLFSSENGQYLPVFSRSFLHIQDSV